MHEHWRVWYWHSLWLVNLAGKLLVENSHNRPSMTWHWLSCFGRLKWQSKGLVLCRMIFLSWLAAGRNRFIRLSSRNNFECVGCLDFRFVPLNLTLHSSNIPREITCTLGLILPPENAESESCGMILPWTTNSVIFCSREINSSVMFPGEIIMICVAVPVLRNATLKYCVKRIRKYFQR